MSNVATFPQARHLIEMFETLGSDQLEALYTSGLLTDLLRCTAELDLTKVNRDEFQRVLGLDPSVFIVKMGGPENTDQIMAALGFSFDDWIIQKNFPLKPAKTPWEDVIEIVDPDTSFMEAEGLKILEEKGLERPTYEHAIRFGQQHGKATTSEKKPFVLFLYEALPDPDGNRHIVFLNRDAKYRRLYLGAPGHMFLAHYVLAGVRPRK